MRSNDGSEQKLAKLQQQLAAWRKSRTSPRQRIPPGLWQQAAKLARHCGVCRVSEVLHLNYYGLKRRLSRPIPPRREVSAPLPGWVADRPAFVELPLVSGSGLGNGGCRVEVEQREGAKLVLHLARDHSDPLAALSLVLEAFWRNGQ